MQLHNVQIAPKPQWLVTLLVSILIATDIFLYCFILPILPFLLSRSHVTLENTPLWSSVLMASAGGAFLVAAPIVGVVAHRGRHQLALMWLALGLMAISTGVLWIATSPSVMAMSRAFQGVSTALVWVVAPAWLVRTVGLDRAGGALGSMCSVMCLSLAVSPLIVGMLYDLAGFHSMFGVAYGLIAGDAVLLFFIGRRVNSEPTLLTGDPTSPSSSDTPSTLSSPTDTVSLTVPLQGKVPVPSERCASQHNSGAATRPLGELLGLRSIWMAMLANGLFNAVLTAFDAQASNFLVQIFEWTSLKVGLAFLAFYGPTVALGLLIGKLNDRYGTRWLTLAGLVMSCPAWIALRFVKENSDGHKGLFLTLLITAGTGVALSQTSLTVVFAHLCGPSAYTQSYGLYNVSAAAGQLLGPLCIAPVCTHGGWPLFTLVLGILCIAAAPSMLLLPAGRPTVVHTGSETGSETQGDSGNRSISSNCAATCAVRYGLP